MRERATVNQTRIVSYDCVCVCLYECRSVCETVSLSVDRYECRSVRATVSVCLSVCLYDFRSLYDCRCVSVTMWMCDCLSTWLCPYDCSFVWNLHCGTLDRLSVGVYRFRITTYQCTGWRMIRGRRARGKSGESDFRRQRWHTILGKGPVLVTTRHASYDICCKITQNSRLSNGGLRHKFMTIVNRQLLPVIVKDDLRWTVLYDKLVGRGPKITIPSNCEIIWKVWMNVSMIAMLVIRSSLSVIKMQRTP